MDSLFLLQFACFIFMLINAFIVALSHLHVRWENKRYERSRWMIVGALIGLAIQYVLQMTFGFRAMHDNLGALQHILYRQSYQGSNDHPSRTLIPLVLPSYMQMRECYDEGIDEHEYETCKLK